MIVIKFLLILLLVFFLLGRVGWFILKVLARKAATGQGQHSSNTQRSRYDGDIRIDYIPEQEQQKRRKRTSKGGDYTEYEEVK
jgi:hypothetical protein